MFGDLVGLTLKSIDGMIENSTEIIFITEDGRRFEMYHLQDCREDVRVIDVIGDPSDLIGHPIAIAEESSRIAGEDECLEHGTWTFYNLGCMGGYVTIRWLGESSGYYCEEVSFEEKSAKST